jgi:hypothetical protein
MEHEPRNAEPEVSVSEMLRRVFRVVAAMLGVVMIIIGIYFAAELFSLGYAAITEPERFSTVVDRWSEYIGGDEKTFVINPSVQISPRILAFLGLGGWVVLMIWLCQMIITAGARIVYWMGTDANAIRRVLGHIFGPSVIKVVREPNLRAPRPFESENHNQGE